MPPQNPMRKFKKKDGTSCIISPFYNVEGEASMRIRDPVEMLDLARSVDLQAHMGKIKKETLAYQSWLWSFTNLCDDPSLSRKVKTSTQDASGKWHTKSKKINTHLVCSLLPERYKDGSRVKADEWGDHIDTAKEYRDRMQRSNMERMGNTREDDKDLQLSLVPPPDWSSEMSSQTAAEGFEHLVRPPTLVSLELRYFLENCDPSVKKTRTVRISKPPKVAVPWDTKAADPKDLSNYGTPANDPVSVETMRKRRDDMQARLGEMRLEALIGRRQARMEQRRKKVEEGLTLPRSKREIMTESELGEFAETTMHAPEVETARYLSWMTAPEVMRRAALTDRFNKHIPYKQRQIDFDKQFPRGTTNELECFFNSGATESDRLHNWLASRDVVNNQPKRLKPLELSPELSARERRRQLTIYRLKSGPVSAEIIEQSKKLLDLHFQLKKEHRWRKQAPVIVGPPVELLSREDKFDLVRGFPRRKGYHAIGLDVQIPMNSIEYRNITRTKGNSVDSFIAKDLYENILTEPFGCYGPIADVLAERSYIRVKEQLHKPIIGSIELGDAYQLDDGIGFFMPNYKSIDLERVLDQVSR
jgi:hypothetical protein